jgi:hypothetical protein
LFAVVNFTAVQLEQLLEQLKDKRQPEELIVLRPGSLIDRRDDLDT